MSIFKKQSNKEFKPQELPFVSAIIVAAGNSTRMGGVNKQFLLIDGVPVLVRTLLAFSQSGFISEIIISAREQDIAEIYTMIKDYGIKKVKTIIKGGETRQKSVFNAIGCCSSNCEYLAIHDGARPLVSNEIIEDTVESAFNFGAAATATRVKDTIKVVNQENIITDTPNRETLWAVQTPQVFNKKLYLDALKNVAGSESFTDDCKLVEVFGYNVHITEGSYENIKITTPEDVVVAEAFINRGEDDEF